MSTSVTITNVNGTLYDQNGNVLNGLVPTLEQVLDSGDDASEQQILNAGRLTTVSNYGQSSTPSVVVKDRESVNELFILPNVSAGDWNPINSDGSISIIGTQNGTSDVATLTIAPHSSTSCGVKMTSSSLTIGAGGSDTTPSNGVTFDSSQNTIRGDWTQFLGRAAYSETNNGVYMIPSAPSLDGTSIPAFEFKYNFFFTRANKLDGTITLSYNYANTNNYTVFPTIYFGDTRKGKYGGETFTAEDTARYIQNIVIYGITNTSFKYVCGVNRNEYNPDSQQYISVYLGFLIVYNIAAMQDYPKSY